MTVRIPPLVKRSSASLDAREIALLEQAIARVTILQPHADIVREGSRPTDCNLLLEGMVARYTILADGRRQILSFSIPGDLFDAQSFLIARMDHSVATLTTCTIAAIPHAALHRLVEEAPNLGKAVWRETLIDAAIFRQGMASIGRRSAYQRIAHLMCELYLRSETAGLCEVHRMEWPLTQMDLGDALGLSVVHVNRTLQELRREGLIVLQSGALIIQDWDALREAGEFDATYLHIDA